MSLLSDVAILKAMDEKRIVITPFLGVNLGTNSYDVTLGNFYYSQWQYSSDAFAWNPSDPESVQDFWAGPYNSEDTKGVILIPKGQTVLAHTQEIIGGRDGITTSIRARSTIARCALSIAKCAGLGDVGFINKWTLEISNHSTLNIILRTGTRVGQMTFYDVGATAKEYQGKYGQDTWEPADMLPKLWKDREFNERK